MTSGYIRCHKDQNQSKITLNLILKHDGNNNIRQIKIYQHVEQKKHHKFTLQIILIQFQNRCARAQRGETNCRTDSWKTTLRLVIEDTEPIHHLLENKYWSVVCERWTTVVDVGDVGEPLLRGQRGAGRHVDLQSVDIFSLWLWPFLLGCLEDGAENVGGFSRLVLRDHGLSFCHNWWIVISSVEYLLDGSNDLQYSHKVHKLRFTHSLTILFHLMMQLFLQGILSNNKKQKNYSIVWLKF